MTTLLFFESASFGVSKKSLDNKFISFPEVSQNQASMDNCMIVALQNEVRDRLEKEVGLNAVLLSLSDEPRFSRGLYEGKTESLFINDSVSFHHFTDETGKITRRVLVYYPMTFSRRGELLKYRFLRKVESAMTEEGEKYNMEIVDLRHFQKESKFLEGRGALNFSHNGEFVYMALSGRSNEEVLDVLCAPENLNIPKENRFVFEIVLPRRAKNEAVHATGEDTVCYTSLGGWCGKGICAWGLEFIRFQTEEEQEAFYDHLEKNYTKIINLEEDELRAFCGNAFEVAVRKDDHERRVLCISDAAYKALRHFKLQILKDWYGSENILVFYADVLERRGGRSIGSLFSSPVIHGGILPVPGELGFHEVAKLHVKDTGH
ncbi:hypothetical protein TRVL_04808 [Trypanosoma vivax]|uniref:Amidinotransferase n=1 Tax=Trypanosoma vivax (strain Y486) TaxID=1055687 RepID=G0TU00_TRYVY|nr:hypothetical protein TRVL_04808 [Trypanosoma vivax]CCC47433.1 conserved hypothetical protein [Trypanosoma vivax Y486]